MAPNATFDTWGNQILKDSHRLGNPAVPTSSVPEDGAIYAHG